METNTTTETAVVETNEVEEAPETITVSRKDYDKMNQTLGSLKKQQKDWIKAQTAAQETTEKTETKEPNFGLLQKSYLRAAGIVDEDEVELAREVQEKTGMEWDKLVDDDYFQSRLTKFRRSRENIFATANIKGGAEHSEAKTKPEYWLAKGAPPTAQQVPNSKVRAQIVRAFMADAKVGKKFYND